MEEWPEGRIRDRDLPAWFELSSRELYLSYISNGTYRLTPLFAVSQL